MSKIDRLASYSASARRNWVPNGWMRITSDMVASRVPDFTPHALRLTLTLLRWAEAGVAQG
jgi:hypothetical protein